MSELLGGLLQYVVSLPTYDLPMWIRNVALEHPFGFVGTVVIGTSWILAIVMRK
jgi:hypothetical protein